MTDITYTIVEHDGSWAYRLGDVFSETFATHDAASGAAHRAAAEQQLGGQDETIRYQNDRGEWKTELSDGGDRPQTHVKE
ncbi:hypothetical protein MCEMIH16_00781 [Caulobacteraceae bacterium]